MHIAHETPRHPKNCLATPHSSSGCTSRQMDSRLHLKSSYYALDTQTDSLQHRCWSCRLHASRGVTGTVSVTLNFVHLSKRNSLDVSASYNMRHRSTQVRAYFEDTVFPACCLRILMRKNPPVTNKRSRISSGVGCEKIILLLLCGVTVCYEARIDSQQLSQKQHVYRRSPIAHPREQGGFTTV